MRDHPAARSGRRGDFNAMKMMPGSIRIAAGCGRLFRAAAAPLSAGRTKGPPYNKRFQIETGMRRGTAWITGS